MYHFYNIDEPWYKEDPEDFLDIDKEKGADEAYDKEVDNAAAEMKDN